MQHGHFHESDHCIFAVSCVTMHFTQAALMLGLVSERRRLLQNKCLFCFQTRRMLGSRRGIERIACIFWKQGELALGNAA